MLGKSVSATALLKVTEALAVATLGENELHIWHARLSDLADQLPRLGALLCPEERARAGRFYFERDRNAFILSRAILRSLLGEYCRIPADKIAFGYGPRGKPVVHVPAGCSPVEFNVSHSHGMAVYAIARDCPVGIDVEYVREVKEADGIVTGQFAPEEISAYRALSTAAKQRGFFHLWTRKEAYIKALGEGLGHPLDRFAVSLEPGAARFLRIDSAPDRENDWMLRDLALDPSYIAAVAVRGVGLEISCQAWPRVTDVPARTSQDSPFPAGIDQRNPGCGSGQ